MKEMKHYDTNEKMKLLVIIGDRIQTNSSANLCHLAYLRGFAEAGHEITLLCSGGKDYDKDPGMEIPRGIKVVSYDGISLYEALSARIKKKHTKVSPGEYYASSAPRSQERKIIKRIKKALFSLYGVHALYRSFYNKARQFRSDIDYDCVISISTPPASHLLAHVLLKKGHIRAAKSLQIWEDPWYSDAYGFNRKPNVFKEEKRLLSYAEHICYVSPLTLDNQKRLFPESADKMFWQPLPAYYSTIVSSKSSMKSGTFGYFGDYYPVARNILPCYEASKACGIELTICGNSSLSLEPTKTINIYPRLSLDALRPIEAQTETLVFLCNRTGGQIPGKIYQYAATDKTILFILDGTDDEKKALLNYFEPYHRFVFCENTVSDIIHAIQRIVRGDVSDVENKPLTAFEPKKIVQSILEEGMK